MTLILSHSDITTLIDRTEIYDAVERAHAALATGQAQNPGPVSMPLPHSGSALPMVAAGFGSSSVKLLSDMPFNASRGLPTQRSTIVVNSADTGECEAILDGRAITAIRTAAVSAVATAHLSRENSTVLGLVGAGTLAIEHTRAIARIRGIEKVLVWSRSVSTVDRYAAAVADLGLAVEPAGSPREATTRADVLCTLTPSKEPIVQGDWFHPGLHVNAVGAPPRPDHREIDSGGMKVATVFVDAISTTLAKSGDALLAISDGTISEADLTIELGHVVVGSKPGRTSDDEVTLFDSVGIGLQDLVSARTLIARAYELGVGTTVDLSS
ncbi:ornithine cyclodeaminase family protein [Rhodococcoides fascians]|jgi:alanine dehydrogenase|uniref:ornithine cyclodeaminase family protein n=1 Tax=Rhodococcoides fascians TaxID=1828 RepID=UPI0005635140|nr:MULTISPECIES: ornithine cyclodeaminase family protein [Rhodococcus]OZE99932.1 ornithine cyclodeaminase [Rhodococcus sp. 15-1189-1-1a]OZF12510.1 ornithine cyclodeaminase [Rhodococcus sp. 14-2686-1-2]